MMSTRGLAAGAASIDAVEDEEAAGVTLVAALAPSSALRLFRRHFCFLVNFFFFDVEAEA